MVYGSPPPGGEPSLGDGSPRGGGEPCTLGGGLDMGGAGYLDGAALPLLDQVEEIGVASHGLQESLASEQRGGVLFGYP